MSKKTKTFQQKQKYSNQDLALLDEISKKNSNNSTVNNIIRPDNGHLKDDTFKPKKDTQTTNKIITPADLKREEELIKEEAKEYSKEFQKQFDVWKDIDVSSDYDWCTFDHREYLIRIFKMDISKFKKFVTLNYVWSPIMRTWKLEDAQMNEGIFAVAKIVAIGSGIENTDYSVGDIVLLPSTDIVGEDWNPKFLHVMQFQQSKGMAPVLPEGMRQRIPNVEIKWANYKFVRPWIPVPEESDELTYLIPESKVKGKFNK